MTTYPANEIEQNQPENIESSFSDVSSIQLENLECNPVSKSSAISKCPHSDRKHYAKV